MFKIWMFVLSGLIMLFGFSSFEIYQADQPLQVEQIKQKYSRHPAVPELEDKVFDTIVEAGVYSIQLSYNNSNAYEYGGIILEDKNHKFHISVASTEYSGDSTSISHINTHPDMFMVADYHTHPCLPYTHFPALFSVPDISSVMHLNIISFMGDLCTGVIHEFDPSNDSPDDVYVEDLDVDVTSGRFVGKIALTKMPIIMEPKPKIEIPKKDFTTKNPMIELNFIPLQPVIPELPVVIVKSSH